MISILTVNGVIFLNLHVVLIPALIINMINFGQIYVWVLYVVLNADISQLCVLMTKYAQKRKSHIDHYHWLKLSVLHVLHLCMYIHQKTFSLLWSLNILGIFHLSPQIRQIVQC